MMTKLILASASPRRREIFDMAGFAFAVCPARGEEVRVGADPVEIVENLAKAKAREVAGSQKEDCLVLGADTIVVLDGEIMGKPADRADASRMLHALQGRSHQVYTGVALDAVRQGVYTVHSFVQRTDVFVYPMTDAEIEAYMDTGEPFDKAGAYGIQGRFGKYIEKINGDYLNVVGLPLGRLYQEMKRLGLTEDAR